MKVLIIDDDKVLQKSMTSFLEKENFQCESAFNYQEANEKINQHEYDCVLVDIFLPGSRENGYDIVRTIKHKRIKTGLIVITGKDRAEDVVLSLSVGADDHIRKPFDLNELLARIKAVTRRLYHEGFNKIRVNEITVDLQNYEVFVKDAPVKLTKKEFQILLFFVQHKNRVISKNVIAEQLWGDGIQEIYFDSLYTHIKNLRKKLVQQGCRDYIETIYGFGYKFKAESEIPTVNVAS